MQRPLGTDDATNRRLWRLVGPVVVGAGIAVIAALWLIKGYGGDGDARTDDDGTNETPEAPVGRVVGTQWSLHRGVFIVTDGRVPLSRPSFQSQSCPRIFAP